MNQLDLGSRISELRQNRNMTQGELAGRLGVTPQALSKWERNQSVPDVFILANLCRMLGVSADYLLGTESNKITENGDVKLQDEIWRKLRGCMEPLELVFGVGLVSAFSDKRFTEQIAEQRKCLAEEGILMPMVRVRDMVQLESDEFMILSYRQVLYSERIETADPEYMTRQLAKTVRERYADILNRDMVKGLTDNLQIRYPALIRETVPNKISYGFLTQILKQFLVGGNSLIYLEKIIEILDDSLREAPQASVQELVKILSDKIGTKDSLELVLKNRQP